WCSADFEAQNLIRSTRFKYSTNVQTKHFTRHYAKPLLVAVFSRSVVQFLLSVFVFLSWILSVRLPVCNGKLLCQSLCMHTNTPTIRDNNCCLSVAIFRLRKLLCRVRKLWQRQMSCSMLLLANTQ